MQAHTCLFGVQPNFRLYADFFLYRRHDATSPLSLDLPPASLTPRLLLGRARCRPRLPFGRPGRARRHQQRPRYRRRHREPAAALPHIRGHGASEAGRAQTAIAIAAIFLCFQGRFFRVFSRMNDARALFIHPIVPIPLAPASTLLRRSTRRRAWRRRPSRGACTSPSRPRACCSGARLRTCTWFREAREPSRARCLKRGGGTSLLKLFLSPPGWMCVLRCIVTDPPLVVIRLCLSS